MLPMLAPERCLNRRMLRRAPGLQGAARACQNAQAGGSHVPQLSCENIMFSLSKRNALQRFACGLAGLGFQAGSAASGPKPTQSVTQWVHGHSAVIGLPDLMESMTSAGGSALLRGKSYSSNCLHYALPRPAENAVRLCAILLRFRCASGACIRSLRLFDGEYEAAVIGYLHPGQDCAEQRLVLPDSVMIRYGLGVTLELGFEAVERELAISAVGAEFSF